MKKYGLYISGKWRESQNLETFDVANPADGKIVGQVADASIDDVHEAISSADQAFATWSQMVSGDRAKILSRVYQLMMEKKQELAHILTLEQGKPLTEALGEVQYAADFFQWYSGEACRVHGETIPSSHIHKRIFTIQQPVGVVVAITPWNFPAAMITRKVAPALAAGCTVIIKPASQTPLTACKLVELFAEAGVPAGVVNLITGKRTKQIGDALLGDSRVRKVTFTGSTEVGKTIMKKAADTVKRVSLELGGHAPFIVFENADLDKAAQEILYSKFRNAGQTCICTNRIYVQDSIAEAFIERFVEKVTQLKVGDGLSTDTDIGPLIDRNGVEKADEHVKDAVSKGATLVAGGKEIAGLFYEPTILTGVTEEMLISREETFGPVAPIALFSSEEEVIRKANHVSYGLAAYLYTNNLSQAVRVAEKLEYGIVGINDGLPSVAQAPFGGVKESGIGREGGKHGLEEFLEVKYISLKIEAT